MATLALMASGASAQSLYRYQDENGQWQFSDRPPQDATPAGNVQREELSRQALKPTLTLERRQTGDGVEVVANNGYACPVQVVLKLERTHNIASQTPRSVNTVVPANASTPVLLIDAQNASDELTFEVVYTYLPGDPGAVHEPGEPYRVPFAIGQKYRVTQAHPSRTTHASPASHYAMDVALPVGTGIYAARAGTVIEIAYASYSGGTDAADLPKANIVRIVHDDGTLAVYAHLAWNSIRVRPGQRVGRGEYLADSGNTGFSSGPHLHFAVQRNSDLSLTSVPVSFRGPAGTVVTPVSGAVLTAY